MQNNLREFAEGAVSEIKSTSRSVLKSDTGKKMAAGAAIGAVAAAALPVIGWGAGAIIGAGFIAYKRLIK